MEAVERRIKLEENLIKLLIRKNIPINNLPRNARGRILSISPTMLREITDYEVYLDSETFYKYSHLSRAIHREDENERTKLENQISDLCDWGFRFSRFKFNDYNRILKGFDEYCRMRCEQGLYLQKKEIYNRIIKLIHKCRTCLKIVIIL